jgi:hypothetical protein
MDIPQISALAGIAALRACGHPGRSADAPAPIAGYALAFSAAVTGLAVAAQASGGTDWTGAPSEQIAQALYSIARDGLIPGGISDPGATAYIFKGKGSPAPTGRPSPRGRLAMARAAGCDVRTVTVGKADQLTLDDSGDVDHLELDPDARPASWGDLRGVVIHVDDLHTGARRSLWIARADLAERKAKAGQKSAWDTDAIGMALTKAVAIAIARGAIPQASLIPAILSACAAHPAPSRALAIEATTPRQIAEAPPQPAPAPPTQPDPEPTPGPTDGPTDEATDPEPSDDEPLQSPWVTPAITWDSIAARIFTDWDWAGANPDDLHAAIKGAIAEAQGKSQAAGRTLTPEAASRPATLARLVEITGEHLRAM